MPLFPYDREAVVSYARRWAMSRNPRYSDYDGLGGDCTNFASQCIYAGSGVMNYKPTFGWYYAGTNNHSPSWTGVPFLYNFLTRRQGVGPAGEQATMQQVMPGDISQFAGGKSGFSHTQVVVSAGNILALDNILVCTHTYDSIDRPLSSYDFSQIRFIHITGVIK